MPGPKAQTPAPIDRPLSRAYLREFSGWSTAYPPGISEPTSLRLMENVMVNRDGSVRVRPGLRYVSYSTAPDETGAGGASSWPTTSCVGTHESFFLPDGSKAYLYAVRETDGTVGFRVLAVTALGQIEQTLTDVGFDVPQGEAELAFTEDTTYVKYLQIDNKIFALSDAGESMRMFFVGTELTAKRLLSIERPEWTVADKLEVVHPDASWIDSGVPTDERINRFKNPTFELTLDNWTFGKYTNARRSDDFAHSGTYSLKLSSEPTRKNIVAQPLHNVATTGITGWTAGENGVFSVSAVGAYMRVRLTGTLSRGQSGFAISEKFGVEPDKHYRVAFDADSVQGIENLGVRIRYLKSNGDRIGDDDDLAKNLSTTNGRKVTQNFFTPPTGCDSVKILLVGYRGPADVVPFFNVRNVYCGLDSEDDTSSLDGDDGVNFFWTGAVNDSASVYHPPKDISVKTTVDVGSGTFTASIYARAASTVRNVAIDLQPGNPQGIGGFPAGPGPLTSDVAGSWARIENTVIAPADTSYIDVDIRIPNVPRDEFHYLDSGLFERSATADAYFSGASADVVGKTHEWLGDPHASASKESTFSVGLTNPSAETPAANTLISSVDADNTYSFGFFYTFSNDVGESAASQTTVVNCKRGWSQWRWQTPSATGEPSGTKTKDPDACCDQLVAYMPSDVFADAIAAGAIEWSLYMFTWSDQDPMPVTAFKVDSRKLSADSVYGEQSWARATPSQAEVSAEIAPIPTKATRLNASKPSQGSQGLVAADRMILVHDPSAAAVIRWSSNQQGSYTDFSPSKGGGFKTLTSGNLMVPAVVKLWQNPQSVDTLTILCLGVDGYSTGYYMAPSQVASQSEAVNIMGFEETTATPGTTSPYGCEVLNNALYHPLDESLVKSTATNYNINHSTLTDSIQDVWRMLQFKHRIVSSQLDNRLYYLVNNPDGEPVPDGCWGNEVWVLDAAQKQGSWSRWLTPGQSLRKIEQGGRVVMSLIHPSGIFYFDDGASDDHYVDDTGNVLSRNIPWLLETNTQGANRAHDAWAHLQQANIQVGFFTGQLEYGVRGIDLHGQQVEVRKVIRDDGAVSTTAWDLEDFMLIRRDMKEWFFFANSVVDDLGTVQPSSGQISLVQYRYAPSTVNTGYEYGSVETFEYQRAGAAADIRTTDNGVPMPYIDTRRP